MSSHQIQFLTVPARVTVLHRPHLKIITAIAVGLIGSVAPAAAYPVYWPNQTFEQSDDPTPQAPAPRKRTVKRSYPKLADAPKDLVKPRGPLIIAISLGSQHLRIYDANGLFAESPVSTGMRGHSTPMGVFSIIQKSKWHRSNLYSDAPMPYMQRITWSGVALHAGVLPGYAASHGCIRMPMAFATKLWSWGKLGARVIITPGEITPEDISHRLLATHVPAEQPSASLQPSQPGDSVGKTDTITKADSPPAEPTKSTTGTLSQLDPLELRLTSKHDDQAAAGDAPAPPPSAERVRIANAQETPIAPAETTQAAPASAPVSKSESGAVNAEAATAAAPDTSAGSSANTIKDQGRPSETAKDAAAKPDTAVVAAVKRTGHIAVFISRKEGRVYVRQNFEPLFDAPVTIAQSDKPLGTHVFTARADSAEPGSYRWSVISPPTLPKKTDAHAEDLGPRRKRPAPIAEPMAPSGPTAAEALDRLTIPDDVMTRIASTLAPGMSIIVSDQGLGGETGLGTDFIVPLR